MKSEEKKQNEVLYSKIDDFVTQMPDAQGWLKNSVLELARNNFDNVDFGLFDLRNPQTSANALDDQEITVQSQFYLSANQNIRVEKETKTNFEILGYPKPILKVLVVFQ